MIKILIIVVTIFFSFTAKADDTNKMPQAAAVCTACHGKNGLSPNEIWPNLAGQKKQYLLDQLMAFKSDQRINQLMSPIAKTLSDSEMNELADYFSKLPAEEKK